MTSESRLQTAPTIDQAALSWHTQPWDAPAGRTTDPLISGFERIAAIAGLLSPQRALILGSLIDAAHESGGCDVLRPIWRAEEIHRAERLAELTLLLDRTASHQGAGSCGFEMEYRLAICLAASYRALTIQHDLAMRPCATLLRDIASNLVSLFSPLAGSGGILLNCSLERISLPAFKHRALVLIAGTLITDALVAIRNTNGHARIGVALWALEPGLVQFTITDYLGVLLPSSQSELLSDLANLLEAEIAFHPSRLQSVSRLAVSRLDIVFPTRP